MKTPEGLLDRNGHPGKIVARLKVNDEELLEYSHPYPDAIFPPKSGITSACFSLASAGDIISISIMANKGTADFVDVYVDGILRGSSPIPQLLKGYSTLTIKRMVCIEADGMKIKGKTVNMYDMVVKERDTSRDIKLTSNAAPSEVGTIVLKCWRKNPRTAESITPEAKEAYTDADAEKTMGPPNYESHNNWYDLNCNIPSEGLPPPFEMGFCNPTKYYEYKNGNGPKERVDDVATREQGEYTLFTQFVFHIRSTADLTFLGYPNVPVRHAVETPAPKPKSEKLSSVNNLQSKNEPQSESKLDINDILGFSDDPDDDVPLFHRPAKALMYSQKLEQKVKKLETSDKSLKKVVELLPRPTLKEIFQNLPGAEAERVLSRLDTPSTPSFRTASLTTDQTKTVATDTGDITETKTLPKTEKSYYKMADQAAKAGKSKEVVGMPVFVSKQISNRESEEQVATKVTPARERFLIGGLKGVMKTTKPFLVGLKAVPAYNAWLERGPLQEAPKSRSSTPVDQFSKKDPTDGNSSLARSEISVMTERNVITHSQPASSMASSTSTRSRRDREESAHKDITWMSQLEQDNKLNIDSTQCVDMDTTMNEPPTLRNKSPGSTESNTTFTSKQPPFDISDMLSETTEVATEFEIQEMVNRSQRNPFQTPENSIHSFSFQSLPRGDAYHSRPSPILGSSVDDNSSFSAPNSQPDHTSSFGLRVRTVSPSGLAATQNRLSRLQRDTEIERPRSLSPGHHALANKDKNQARNINPVQMSPWHRRGSEIRGNHFLAGMMDSDPPPLVYVDEELNDDPMTDDLFVQSVDPALQKDNSPELLGKKLISDTMGNDWMYPSDVLSKNQETDETNDDFTNTIQKISLEKPKLVQPHSTSYRKLSQKRKLDATGCHGESHKKTNRPQHERKTTEAIASKLQAVTATKGKAEYMIGTTADHHSPTPNKMPASELAKVAMTTAEFEKIKSATSTGTRSEVRNSISTPTLSKRGSVAGSFIRVTPDRMLTPAPLTPDEISTKRKATQERITAAVKRKEALRKELEDAQALKQHLNEIRELEKAAENSERENEELQAQIEAIYGAVDEQ